MSRDGFSKLAVFLRNRYLLSVDNKLGYLGSPVWEFKFRIRDEEEFSALDAAWRLIGGRLTSRGTVYGRQNSPPRLTVDYIFPEDIRKSNEILEVAWARYGSDVALCNRHGQIVPRIPVEAVQDTRRENAINSVHAILLPAHAFEKHLMFIILTRTIGHSRRDEAVVFRKFAEWSAFQHIVHHPQIVEEIGSDRLFPKNIDKMQYLDMPAYKLLATSLTERERYEEAIAICELAIDKGIHDNTKTGFAGRIERIRSKAVQRSSREALSSDWNYTCSWEEYCVLLHEVKDLLEQEYLTNLAELASREVPQLLEYWRPPEYMSVEQKSFYLRWQSSWTARNPINSEGIESYIRCYVKHEVLNKEPAVALNELRSLCESYHNNIGIVGNCLLEAYRIELDLGQIDNALRTLAEMRYSQAYFALKYVLRKRITGTDILTLFNQPILTTWARANLDLVLECADIIVEEYERDRSSNLLSEWIQVPNDTQAYEPNSSLPSNLQLSALELRRYRLPYWEDEIQQFMAWLAREAENVARTQMGLPRVGEGWVSETQLYYEITAAFPELEVQQHASPSWLGRQHLDVFIPQIKVALEYQGIQHLRSVGYFGGDAALEQTKERDSRKLRLCQSNNVHLIYVFPDYVLDKVIYEIKKHM